MIERIEKWIRQVNTSHEPLRRSCSVFQDYFSGFYSPTFLASAHFVIVESIPKPDLPELREAGLGDFIDMDVAGITYDDTYYVQRRAAKELRLHFHELVHVLQWRQLKPSGLIKHCGGQAAECGETMKYLMFHLAYQRCHADEGNCNGRYCRHQTSSEHLHG